MKKSRFSEEEIIGILKQQEAGQKVVGLAREHGVSETTCRGERMINRLKGISNIPQPLPALKR